ncbi:hypermethylated in cancer 1 protein isoform 1 [Gallus gallus]|uniref:Isoform 1 of Hypermethylated in cancer 1 protein n=1 Tax=Gallus gallus TaxID=9031 RepID=Q90850-2|nr:hypermethylated in cancer 1 protein isoform 1 [Gallus gallus]NP_990567.1 hypermethylated in cancer 1 protein isoform 1 [Gallus gallus]CAA55653.1 gammaFBP-A [Gallus gallus]|eukprot:NP_990567.1 hypermethylated in cancer 1 protein [Gallus gallus]
MRVHRELGWLAEGSGRAGRRARGAMLEAMEVPSHSRQLLLQLNTQRTKGFLCDVIIVVQNALFRAHKNILAASSAYLKSLVVHDNLLNLDHEMVSPGIFRLILDFIYTGRLGECEPGGEQSLGAVLAAASYLQIPGLVALCKKKLKRSGKYCHLRGGYAPYKLGRGLRATTPVIQACYSGTPRPVDLQPVEPAAPLNTQCGELYASASQGTPLHPHGLCPPERHCSPPCGLDLSKKSPTGPSAQLLPTDRLLPAEPREPSLPPRHDSPPVSGGLLAGHPAAYKDSPPGGEPGGHPHATDPFRSTPPCAEPPLPRGDGRELMYRWMKHEPLGPYLDEGEAEKELEREEKAESPPAAPQPRYPSVESNDLEPDNSTSEETGSSEGPSPGDALDRYCNHLGYEPESLGDNLYVCIPCGKGFPSSEQLNAHVEAHNEEELYHKAAAEQAVPFLDKGGAGLGDILRPYRCSSCDKSYKDPATLRQHEKTHWLTRPYPCTICGKKFTQRGTMTRHMRSHLGLKPFACDACGMRFTRQYRLTEHMRIHSGEKPYECQVCGGKFAQQRNLISHMKMHAAGPDGKAKLDFPDSVYAMARLTADQLGLKQEKAAELLSHTSHFLSDPKAMESLYPLAKFTAEHLGLSQDKAAEVLAQAPHLHADAARTIERYSPP